MEQEPSYSAPLDRQPIPEQPDEETEEQENGQENETALSPRARKIIAASLWALTLLIAVAATFFVTRRFVLSETAALQDALSLIRSQYFFYDAEQDALIDGAIKGMADSLNDVYAVYYTEEEYAALTQSNSGYYTGVGILLRQEDVGSFVIEDVYANTPAEEAGLLAGDLLLSINGMPSDGLDISTFLSYMQTGDGDQNDLIVRRGKETISFSVVARQVYSPTVTYRMQTDTVGYIRLSAFHGECVTEMKEAIESLREQGMQSLILDLRGNPGGNLYDACDIADLFLSKGLLITSLQTRQERVVEYRTKTEGYEFPMAVLVDGGTGSASELLSGALKDHGRAVIIGTQTYGKGIVQSYLPVTGTGGYLKLTTEAYFTPSGVCIHGVGVTPDQVVENPEEAASYSIASLPESLDEQLKTAVAILSAA